LGRSVETPKGANHRHPCGIRRLAWPRSRSLHTREVAGSKPAAPIVRFPQEASLTVGGAIASFIHLDDDATAALASGKRASDLQTAQQTPWHGSGGVTITIAWPGGRGCGLSADALVTVVARQAVAPTRTHVRFLRMLMAAMVRSFL
jgi:hypothetical protein